MAFSPGQARHTLSPLCAREVSLLLVQSTTPYNVAAVGRGDRASRQWMCEHYSDVLLLFRRLMAFGSNHEVDARESADTLSLEVWICMILHGRGFCHPCLGLAFDLLSAASSPRNADGKRLLI